MNINYLLLLTFTSGLISFIVWRKHFLMTLLSLEFITVSVYFALMIMINFNSSNMFFSMIYLSIAVCEGVLGLSVMVVIIRSVGNEFVISFNVLW